MNNNDKIKLINGINKYALNINKNYQSKLNYNCIIYSCI